MSVAAEIEKADRALAAARISLMFRHPFFGSLCVRMERFPAHRSWCPTAATDGKNLYYCPFFINRLTREETVFVLAHEVAHCMYRHLDGDLDGRNHRLLNIAQDYLINGMLESEICGPRGNGNAAWRGTGGVYAAIPRRKIIEIYLDRSHDGKTSLEIYDELLRNPPPEASLLDAHLPMGGAGEGSPMETDADGLVTSPASHSESGAADIGRQIDDAMISAASRDPESVPSGAFRNCRVLAKPRIQWRDALPETLRSLRRRKISWAVPNRKNARVHPAVLPGRARGRRVEACAAIDSSGSVSMAMARRFIGELSGLMEEFDDFALRMWQFDAEVHNDRETLSGEDYDLRDWGMRGGGGTLFQANWDHMRRNAIEPRILLVFTDGRPFGNHWGEPSYCETMFVICGDPRDAQPPAAPFGVTVFCDP